MPALLGAVLLTCSLASAFLAGWLAVGVGSLMVYLASSVVGWLGG